MPIIIKVTEGALNKAAQRKLLVGVRETVKRIGLVTNSPFDLWQLMGNVETVPKSNTYPDQARVVIDIGLAINSKMVFEQAQQQAFIADITQLAVDFSNGKLEKNDVCLIILYGTQFWGVAGVQQTAHY